MAARAMETGRAQDARLTEALQHEKRPVSELLRGVVLSLAASQATGWVYSLLIDSVVRPDSGSRQQLLNLAALWSRHARRTGFAFAFDPLKREARDETFVSDPIPESADNHAGLLCVSCGPPLDRVLPFSSRAVIPGHVEDVMRCVYWGRLSGVCVSRALIGSDNGWDWTVIRRHDSRCFHSSRPRFATSHG